MSIGVYHYEAFSAEPGKGNPAGVVVDAKGLDELTMQAIAREIGFNETAFVLPSTSADLRLRYFTPGHEIKLCGHATVASLFALHDRGLLKPGELTVETRAGVLPMAVRTQAGRTLIEMTQAPAEFSPFEGDRSRLAAVLGVSVSELHPELPIFYGSTGTWTLLVPVKGLAVIRRIRPRTAEFPGVLDEMPRSSIHPFCFETEASDAQLSARHFSSPFSGTVEDPITGTASGVMGAFMATQRPIWMAERDYSIVVEQGRDVGRDGRVHVKVTNREPPFKVRIAGAACYVGDLKLSAH